MNPRNIHGSGGTWGAAQPRTVAQPRREVKRCQPLAAAQTAGHCDVLTTCKTKTSAFHQRPPSGMKERLGPPSGPATIPRTIDARIPPNLLNSLKGLRIC